MAIQREVLVVLAADGPATTIQRGEVGPYRLNVVRARKCRHIIVVQSRDRPGNGPFAEHLDAYLIADLGEPRPVKEGDEERWLLPFSNPEEISVRDFWTRSRNPVRYVTEGEITAAMGDSIVDRQLPGKYQAPTPRSSAEMTDAFTESLLRLKRGTASALGIEPDLVEITITIRS